MARLSLLWLALLLSPGAATGHALAPSVLELDLRRPEAVELVWRSPARVPAGDRLWVELVGCESSAPTEADAAAGAVAWRWRADCSAGRLERARVRLVAPESSARNAIVRLRDDRGRRSLLLHRDQPETTLEPGASGSLRALRHLVAGFRHIWAGVDHLAFVAGLLWLVAGRGRRLATLSTFTLGHSVTLALGALGAVPLPALAVELAIAASLYLLALRMLPTSGSDPARALRAPFGFAFGFGLLHGLGFASGLNAVGLEAGDLVPALAGFNVGVELGQLAFVALLGLANPVLRRLPAALPAHAVGALAVWTGLERLLGS